MSATKEVTRWILEFQESVRNKDFDHGEQMFDAMACCFGSKETRLSDRQELVERQWKSIWGNITDFTYDLESLKVFDSEDTSMVCAMCLWHSKGYHQNGESFSRPGRVTFVLKKNESGKWLAVHSHYSLIPGTPTQTVIHESDR